MSNKKSPMVAIVILNFNGGSDTIECLESVFQIDYQNFLVGVLDNGSIDDSVEMIKNYCNGEIKIHSPYIHNNNFHKPINFIEITKDHINYNENHHLEILNEKINLFLIANGVNDGFSGGNNIAMSFFMNYFKPEYFLLLNNDVVVSKNLLKDLIESAERDLKIGIIGPAVYHYSKSDEIQSAGVLITKYFGIIKTLTFNKELNKIPSLIEVDSLSGSALLVKTQLIENIGLLDAAYFAYWEETDWCLRAKEDDYKVVVAPRVKVWHKGGSTSKKIKGFTEYLMVRNKFWFMRTHLNKIQFFSFLFYFFAIKFWIDTVSLLLLHQNTHIYKNYVKGIIDGLKGKNQINRGIRIEIENQ